MKSILLALLLTIPFSQKAIAEPVDCNQQVSIDQASQCINSKAPENLETEEVKKNANTDESLQFWIDMAVISRRGCNMIASGEYTNAEIFKTMQYSVAEIISYGGGAGVSVNQQNMEIALPITEVLFKNSKKMHSNQKCTENQDSKSRQ